jgi:hypothetical protein
MEDFNEADKQRSDVIPQGTVAVLEITVRPGGVGEGGWLKRSKDGNSEGLDGEFTVVEGQHAKRKLFTLFTLNGVTEGHAEAGRISRSKIRAMLESARGIKPSDTSEAAKKARTVENFGDLNGLRFIARIGVEPPKGNYKAKNIIADIITPEHQNWHKVEQLPLEQKAATAPTTTAATTPTTPANAVARPKWAGPPQSPPQSSPQ